MSTELIDRSANEIASHRSWHIASRWQEFEGEMRTALLRSILVVVFYAIQLIHYATLETISETEKTYHRQITYVAIAWLFASLAVLVLLKSGIFPAFLKYITTTVDLALVTVLAVLGKGPNSPLLLVLFLVISLSAIRFRIGLVWFTTIGAMIAYMILVASADRTWFDADHVTPLLTQGITLCSLAATGVVLGQIVRAARSMADGFVSRMTPSTEKFA